MGNAYSSSSSSLSSLLGFAGGNTTGEEEEPPREEEIVGEPFPLRRLVKEHPDVFEVGVLTRLSTNEIKFFYDVNTENRACIKRFFAHAKM